MRLRGGVAKVKVDYAVHTHTPAVVCVVVTFPDVGFPADSLVF